LKDDALTREIIYNYASQKFLSVGAVFVVFICIVGSWELSFWHLSG